VLKPRCEPELELGVFSTPTILKPSGAMPLAALVRQHGFEAD